jgi:hypothetical protein
MKSSPADSRVKQFKHVDVSDSNSVSLLRGVGDGDGVSVRIVDVLNLTRLSAREGFIEG